MRAEIKRKERKKKEKEKEKYMIGPRIGHTKTKGRSGTETEAAP